MKAQTESRIYFTEKDIYDALMSSKRTMTMSLLLELARDKGILLSSDDSREDIIKYLSSLVYDYYDLNVLIEHITPAHKKEKSKVTKINTEIDDNQLKTITKNIDDGNTTIQVTTKPDNPNKTVLEIEYDEIDFSKTRLRQKIRKKSTIEITKDKGESTISKPSNDKVDQIMESILSGIEQTTSEEINEDKIDLHGWNHSQKIEYFTTLIDSIDECKMFDVIKVSVNHEDNPEVEEEVLNMITNASFKGKGLLSTPEYQKLKDDGYFITSIIWKSEELKKNGNHIEFEAGLSSGSNSEEVIFAVKGAYRFVEKDKYTTTRRPLTPEESEKYTKVLETSAFKVFNDIKSQEE
ncbi:MAG: hypothetical protein P794_03855 [Epsilonproteobacteria bacterium (ex Lamellibrachia satsuma)]|nr:MAG: hypothetical protein P794_03855 [Epsilonproteobacteria bacterium (ex Lamellibrachia satsuma)]